MQAVATALSVHCFHAEPARGIPLSRLSVLETVAILDLAPNGSIRVIRVRRAGKQAVTVKAHKLVGEVQLIIMDARCAQVAATQSLWTIKFDFSLTRRCRKLDVRSELATVNASRHYGASPLAAQEDVVEHELREIRFSQRTTEEPLSLLHSAVKGPDFRMLAWCRTAAARI